MFILGILAAITGLFCFLVYVFTHWAQFVGQSGAIAAFLLFVGAATCICLIAWLGAMALSRLGTSLIELGHGIVSIYHRFSEAQGQKHKNMLLHTAENYIVYVDKGRIIGQLMTAPQGIATQSQLQIEETAPAIMPALPEPILTFAQLLERGIVQAALAQGKMLLGYSNGQLRYGSWLDLYSCGIGGVSGSGKTTTVRFLLFQALLAMAQLIMIDPHIHDPEESLAAQFMAFPWAHMIKPCDSQVKAVLKRVRWLQQELDRRKHRGAKTPFLIFVIDEFNAVMRIEEVKEELKKLLLDIEQEGRKFGIFAMLIGQRWSAQDLGGADIRTSLASMMAHRFTDEDQAKKMIGGKNGPRCLELEKGHHLFRDTDGKLSEMITPLTIMEDGAIITQILGAGAAPGRETTQETTLKPRETTGYIPETTSAHPIELGAYDRSFEPESSPDDSRESTKMHNLAVEVLALQVQNTPKNEIMRKLWGVNPGASEAYKQACEEYTAVMQYISERIGVN